MEDETIRRWLRTAWRALRFWREDRPFLSKPDGDRFRFWVHFAWGALVGVGLGLLHAFAFGVSSHLAVLALTVAFAVGLGWAAGRYGNSLWELLF